jgi:hypothetical protein
VRGADVPQAEIERARLFLRQVRNDRADIGDAEIIGPHMAKTTYAQLLRLFAWYGLERAKQEQPSPAPTSSQEGGYPKNLQEMRAKGYKPLEGRDGTNLGHCRDCGEEIEWWATSKGRKLPFNPMRSDRDAAVAHFTTCSEKGR